MAHPGGRPNEYKPEYIGKVDEYLTQCEDEYDEFHKTRGERSDSYDRIVKVKLPTIEGFASFLGVAKSSLYLWEKSHSEFSDALDKIIQLQKERLLQKGLSGEYNSTIAKLILSSNHGMSDKNDITTDGQPVTFSINPDLANKNGINTQAN